MAVYLGVAFIGIPLSTFVVPAVTPTATTAISTTTALTGFSLMYCVARGLVGYHKWAFAVLVLGVLLVASTREFLVPGCWRVEKVVGWGATSLLISYYVC